MAEASLLFVRDDRAVADKLARALEANGVAICASVSALEENSEYDAVVALFSGTAVKSPLLMERALAAEHEGKLVPVFVGLCHLQPPLNKLVFHDLCEWQGDVNDVALQAIRAHVMRIARARSAGELLRAGMRAPEPELEPPPPPRPDPAMLRRREDDARRAQQRVDQEETLARLERERQERATARIQDEAAARARAEADAVARQEQERLEDETARQEQKRALDDAAALANSPLEDRHRREREHRARELAQRQSGHSNSGHSNSGHSNDFMRPTTAERDAPHDDRDYRERNRRDRDHWDRDHWERSFTDREPRDNRQKDRDIGDPFGGGRRRGATAETIDTAPAKRRRAIGLADWASDVLVMTLVAVGAIAAIVIAAQPEAARAVAQGLNAEVAALLQSVGR